MTIDDVMNAKKLDFITKVYRQGEYTQKWFRIRVMGIWGLFEALNRAMKWLSCGIMGRRRIIGVTTSTT